MKYLVALVVVLAALCVWVLIGSLVVGTVGRVANRRIVWSDDDAQLPIIFGIMFWPLVVIVALLYYPARHFLGWSVGLVDKLTQPKKPKPRDDWSE